MLRKKPNPKKQPVTRVKRKRNRHIATVFLCTVIASGLAILLAFVLVKEPKVISPISVATLGVADSSGSELTKELATYNIHTEKIMTGEDTITLKLSSTQEVLLSSKTDLRKQLSSLQLIVARLTMEGKHFSRLDLRFDKPVILFGK